MSDSKPDIDAEQQAFRERIREAAREAFQRPRTPQEIEAGAARFLARAIPLPAEIVREVLREAYPNRPSREEIIRRGNELVARQEPLPPGQLRGEIIVPLTRPSE